MSFAKVYSRALLGVDSPLITIEVHASRGLPAFNIVGLPEASVKESRERVRSALLSIGFDLPPMRLTVNLAPADLPKHGGRFDLPIAIGVLIASEQIQWPDIESFELYAELGLSGDMRPTKGALPSLIASERSGRTPLIAAENGAEAALLFHNREGSGQALTFSSLSHLIQWRFHKAEPLALPKFNAAVLNPEGPCLSEVNGQLQAKRVLEICASGGHSLLMMGEPGAGKSMLASRLAGILPPLSQAQALEVASIRSLVDERLTPESFYQRPFMQPHHTSSAASLIGGGSIPRPGAISLAHRGVLFLDELPEFSRPVLEALREPLETGVVDISRVQQHVRFPAQSLLVTALNPSPSGYFPDDAKGRCKDTPNQIANYLKRISGPLLDRIDCHIEVPAVEIDDLQRTDPNAETSVVVQQRVVAVQARQQQRQGCLNSELSAKQLQQLVPLTPEMQAFLKQAMQTLGLSARAYHRLLRVALTLADMAQQSVALPHLAEALSYRQSQRITELL